MPFFVFLRLTVVDGMDYVDAIARGEPPVEPDKIVRMSLIEE